MNARSSLVEKSADRTLMITRVFDAPAPKVYQAFTTPERIRQWWGPRGFTTLTCELDLRTDGVWRVRSRSAEGTEHAERGVFREIVPSRRLVFTHAWEDAESRLDHETLVTLTFTELDGKTTINFQQGVFDSVASRDGHEEGWSSAFELLAEYLLGVERSVQT